MSPGEILARGFQVMIGYFDNPDATAETIDADGWLHTGDVGYVDADNNVTITDRIKDMFIVGGFNAYPAEIEGLMLDHPDLAQVAIVGVPDAAHGRGGHGVRRADGRPHRRRRLRSSHGRASTWPTTRRRATSRWSTRCR